MIKNKKLSLSLLNSLLLLSFLIIISLAILIGTYINTQKVVDKNIDDYFNQTINLTDLILENEYDKLNTLAYKISKDIYKDKTLVSLDEVLLDLEDTQEIDDLDMLFLKINEGYIDYSNSLFETEKLIEKINTSNYSVNNEIINIKLEDKEFIILLSSKKIIDNQTGRVKATLFVGKIFNDNFTFLNTIKEKAKIDNVYLYFDNQLIATTNDRNKFDLNRFEKNNIVHDGVNIYSLKKLDMYNNKFLDIVFISKNTSFHILKESFIRQAFFLLLFVIVSFIILYFLSNKYIIKPFSKLHDYAHKIKDNKDVKYEGTQVVEFDEFAVELKDIIDEIRDLKEQYSRAIDGVQDGLWDIDLKSKKIYYSNRFKNMLGYDDNELINKKSFWQRSIHKEDYKKTLEKLRSHLIQKSDIFEMEYRFKCKDGSFKWIKIRGKLFFDENKLASRMIGFHTDIDHLVLLEDENTKKEQMLYQQSKLAAMGEMIGNIAHQWRQPLTVISVIASTVSMQIDMDKFDKNSAKNDLKKLLETVQYLSSIIDKFRHFFNPDKKVEEFSIKTLVNNNLEIFESSYKSNGIKLFLDLNEVYIYGYKFELMQVIINIINNSRDALLEKYDAQESKYIFIKCYEDNNDVFVEIYDNAGGIDKSIKDKIYEPYFTTKHQSQGTGIGLYMSNEIIKKHFYGELKNETIEYTYKEKSYTGECFTIVIPN